MSELSPLAGAAGAAALAALSMAAPAVAPNSRYAGIPTASIELPDGRTVTYFRRRFVPAPDRFETLMEHRVEPSDRLDLIAARYIGDAELAWRICDANGAIDPEELLAQPGRTLRITAPLGLPGIPAGPR